MLSGHGRYLYPVKITLLCIGATHASYIAEGMAQYESRLQHYISFKTEIIPEKKVWKKLPVDQRRKAEGDAILGFMQPGDLPVLLDEGGKEMSSRAFSKILEKWMVAGHKQVVLIVGGAFGFSEEVYGAVNQKLSLSKMTFNHDMVRLFTLEQLYRGFSILRGEPYHND